MREKHMKNLAAGAAVLGCLLVSLGLGSGLECKEGKPTEGEMQKAVSVSAQKLQDPVPAARAARTFNLLLLGQDQQQPENGKRSDCMMLCTICPENSSLTLTSVLRDLYVQIPGYGKNRLNAAYAFGGTELLERTLRNNLGAAVDGCIEVDFNSFPALVDLLGGVALELRQDEAEEINRKVPGSDLHEGTCILTGEQALAYSRIRVLDADADVSRTRRQRRILETIFASYQKASPATLLSLIQNVLPMVSTDLSLRELLAIAGALLPVMDRLQVFSGQIPAAGTYQDLRVDGMDVLQADLQANRRELGKILCPALSTFYFEN